MNKEINYTGFSTVPSDYLAPDGSLALSLNLLNENGALQPILPPTVQFTLPTSFRSKSYTLLMRHKAANETYYIIACEETSPIVAIGEKPKYTTTLYFISKSEIDSMEQPSPQLEEAHLHKITTVEGRIMLHAIVGNVIALSGPELPLFYLLWRDNSYHQLPQLPTFVPLEFSMQDQTSNQRNFSAVFTRYKLSDSSSSLNTNYSIHSATDAFIGAINTIIKTAREKSLFTEPFFLRYALRLFDGSYIQVSEPLMLIPSIAIGQGEGLSAHPLETYHGNPKEDYWTIEFSTDIVSAALHYKVSQQAAETAQSIIDLWGDLVTAVDIFVSAPIYRLNLGKNVSVFGNTRYYGDNADETVRGLTLTCHPNEDFATDIKSAATFYRYASLDLLKIASAPYYDRKLISDDKDLNSLVARPTLSTTASLNNMLTPGAIFSYNNRLTIADITTSPGPLVPLSTLFPTTIYPSHTSSDSWYTNAAAFWEVYCQRQGSWYIRRCVAPLECTDKIPSWLFVTDSNAKYLRLVIPLNKFKPQDFNHALTPDKAPAGTAGAATSDDTFIRIPDPDNPGLTIQIKPTIDYEIILPLTPHDFLSGAFWLNEDSILVPSELPETTVEMHNQLADIRENLATASLPNPSLLYTSEAGNPFAFPVTSATTVGNGQVLALSSAAKALSQGQFGQFPLYAFTTEGVWALQLADDGRFIARQPITRDVCLSSEGIAQLDSSVVFTTARGIMQLVGSQTQCISTPINANTPFQPATLPAIEKVLSLTRFSTKHISTSSFAEFIKSARIVYDYPRQHLHFFIPGHPSHLVLSLLSSQWGMAATPLSYTVNSYPDAVAVNSVGNVLDFSAPDTQPVNAMMLTRPFHLDAPDVLKTVDAVIQRGFFTSGSVASILYASRDLINWHLVWSSKDHYLRGFSGTPYKHFRLLILANFAENESLSSASVQFSLRLTNQPR